MDAMVQAAPEEVGLCSKRLRRVADWARRLVDDGRLAGLTTAVMRHGRVAHLHSCGMADLAAGRAMDADAILRIYSMTKPLTSVAIMMLYEEGHFQLDDPITRFLPCFADMRVATGGKRGKIDTVPAARDITFRDLLTHTSGLTYGFMQSGNVDARYRDDGIDFQTSEATLGELVERLAKIPLIAQPGAEWNYSVATDVLGHLVAVISGEAFGDFLARRVLAPLGMSDTGFHVPGEKQARFAALYGRGARWPAGADRHRGALSRPAPDRLGGRRARLHRRRLPALLPVHAEWRRARGRAAARAQGGRADDHQPSARRHGGDGHAALQREQLRGDRLRARLLGDARSGARADRRDARENMPGVGPRAPRSGSIRPRTWRWCCSPSSCRPRPTRSGGSSGC